MGMTLRDFATYANEAMVLTATPSAKLIEGTIAQANGLTQRISLVPRGATSLQPLSFVTDTVPFTFDFSVTGPTVIPRVSARSQRLGFTGAVALNEQVHIGGVTFQFVTTVSVTDANFIPVSLGSGAPTVAAANLLTRYNLYPGVPTAASVSPTAVSFSHPSQAFAMGSDIANSVHSGDVYVRDGGGYLGLGIPAGMPVTTADDFAFTFGPYTRADGRTINAILANVTAS